MEGSGYTRSGALLRLPLFFRTCGCEFECRTCKGVGVGFNG